MKNSTNSLDYLIWLAMFYVAIDLSSLVFSYKIVNIGPIIGAASSLIFPLTYSIMDIIAEIYGYYSAKKIILFGLICDFIFASIVLLISQIPSSNSIETLSYTQIFNPLLRSVGAQAIGLLIGAFINIYLISKWKIMTKGRYFWLRSIGSSIISEGFALVISVFIALFGILSMQQLFNLIIYAYLYKIIFSITASPFISIITAFIKMRIPTANTEYYAHTEQAGFFSQLSETVTWDEKKSYEYNFPKD